MRRCSPRRQTFRRSASSSNENKTKAAAAACFETPKKRHRKAPNADGDSMTMAITLPSTPSTPHLCDTPTAAVGSRHKTNRLIVVDNNEFVDLCVSSAEFRPSASLTTGQSFHWKALSSSTTPSPNDDADDDNATPANAVTSSSSSSSSAWGAHNATDWIGTLRVTGADESIVVHVRETPQTTLYKILYAPPDENVDLFLRNYFQLQVSLSALYKSWSLACPRLRQIAQCIPGVRILQQDPWETLISFICSSNNNIPRISQILSTLRREYGRRIKLSPVCGLKHEEEVYTFPTLEELRSKTTEADLRRLGWGYRAKYVIQTMETLHQLGGESYLISLREQGKDPVAVQEALLQFAGVGRKVADCTALFSLGQTRAIPVDVHVWNIARRDYDPDQALALVKSLTPTIYKQVGDIFRHRFGDYAGWAHSLLFVAELPSFRPVLPPALIQEMQDFRQIEQARKQELKQVKAKK